MSMCLPSFTPRLLPAALSALVLGLILGACGSQQPQVSGECTSADQKASYMAPVSQFPITVTADPTFTVDQYRDLEAMIKEWNTHGRASIGQDYFVLKKSRIPSSLVKIDPRDCSQTLGTESGFYIVKVTESKSWSDLGFSTNVPGATVRCTSRGILPSDDPTVAQQIVYLNPMLIQDVQFSSVVSHELGHTIGLDHSCIEGSGRTNYAGCSKLKAEHPYRKAVMYPSLSTGKTPEIRNLLQTNDKQRAQCLYSGK